MHDSSVDLMDASETAKVETTASFDEVRFGCVCLCSNVREDQEDEEDLLTSVSPKLAMTIEGRWMN